MTKAQQQQEDEYADWTAHEYIYFDRNLPYRLIFV
jgi:hypothetical protein